MRPGDAPEDAIKHFVSAAADLGIKFKKIQTYGLVKVATYQFIRFQTDCPTFPPIIARLKSAGRGIIAPTLAGYRAHLPNGREGAVNFTTMHEIARPGYGKMFAGSSHEHWRSQFRE